MKCPRCQHENPPQAKFCLECGARVALTCKECRSELPAGAKFLLRVRGARRFTVTSRTAVRLARVLHPQAPRREDPDVEVGP
jgi:hypothetical protein